MAKNLLAIFAIIIGVIAFVISIIALNINDVGEANYIAIAATILTGVVAFAVGYNIYSNLYVTKKVAEETTKTLVTEHNRINGVRVSNGIAASGNYAIAATYFELGNNQKELGVKNKAFEYYKHALKFCEEARRFFVRCEHQDMIEKCDGFIIEINEQINASV